ncbi:MAG: efflux RND transporter periplasmic adaptor subunit [Opitutales bacterium]
MKKLIQKKPITYIIALVFIGAGLLFLLPGVGKTEEDISSLYAIQRGNLVVSVIEGGNLTAASEVSIVSEVEGQTRIISIVPEGTYVERGDLLVELDASDLEERLNQQEISYQNALSSFTEARENLEIRRSQAESDLKAAQLRVEFAGIDLKKYLDGDFPQQRKNAESNIKLAGEELNRAEDRLEHTERLETKGYATRTEYQGDLLTLERRQIELERAEAELEILVEFAHPRRVRELESDLVQAEEELGRVMSRSASQISQAEANVRARDANLALDEGRLNRIKRQLENSKILAPQSGLVIYASDQRVQIEEGATVRQRQEIIKLPDMSQMMVQVQVHESQVSQVKRGQAARITIDSIPDRTFRGHVQRVSILPDAQQRWLNPDLKVYTTDILLEEEVTGVNPGVSARAEIIVAELEDVLSVPIQAVTTLHGHRVLFRSQGAQTRAVPITVGLYNDSFIAIDGPIQEGDRILLSPPSRTDDITEESLLAQIENREPQVVALSDSQYPAGSPEDETAE